MKINRPSRVIIGALVAVASGFMAASAAEPEDLQEAPATIANPAYTHVTIGNFAGHWQMTVIGQTGCGFGTAEYSVTLNAAGTGTATGTYHNGCGDFSTGTVAFHILSVDSHGSGAANLSCGAGCGWALKVQLAPNHDVFNLVDVEPENPKNFIEGSAVRQSY